MRVESSGSTPAETMIDTSKKAQAGDRPMPVYLGDNPGADVFKQILEQGEFVPKGEFDNQLVYRLNPKDLRNGHNGHNGNGNGKSGDLSETKPIDPIEIFAAEFHKVSKGHAIDS